MVTESVIPNVSVNASEIVSTAVDAGKDRLLELISPFIWIIQAIGIALLVYILFLIVRAFMKYKDHLRLKRIEDKLDILIEAQVSQAKLKKLENSKENKKEKKKVKGKKK